MKVWVIAIEIRKIRIRLVGIRVEVVRVRTDIATKFMWRPGIRPEIVPARVPKSKEVIRFSIWLGS